MMRQGEKGFVMKGMRATVLSHNEMDLKSTRPETYNVFASVLELRIYFLNI